MLSIAKNQGAPDKEALNRLFGLYNNNYHLEIESVPNQDLINEVYNGDDPEINRITVEIPVPNAQILEQVLGANDAEIIQAVQQRANTVVFEVKAENRGALCNDQTIIQKIINAYRTGRQAFNKVVLDAKPNTGTRQKSYDLYEEYFKYPIKISEYHTENGRKVENPKENIQRDYRNEMMNIYENYREYILAISDRI